MATPATPPPSNPTPPAAAQPDMQAYLDSLVRMNSLRDRGLDGIKKERDLMAGVLRLSGQIEDQLGQMGIQFNIHNQMVGSVVKEMSTLDKISAEIKNRNDENYSLENSYVSLAKNHLALEIESNTKLLDIQSRMANLMRLKEKAEARGWNGAAANLSRQMDALTNEKNLMNDKIEISKSILKQTADELELNRQLVDALNKQAAQERLKQSMSDKIFGSALQDFAKTDLAQSMGLDKLIATMGPVAEVIKATINLAIKGVVLMYERFLELQKSAEDFRITTGLTVDQSAALESNARKLNIQYQYMGLSLKDAYDVTAALMTEFGNQQVVEMNKSLVETSSLLKTNYGVAAETSAGFLSNIMAISGASADTAENVAAFSVKMSQASGVPLNKIMKEVAGASGTTYGLMRGSSTELVKAAANALRLGTSLETISSAARKSLNFYDSITDEMEASVLVGENLSFQKARERSFAGDLLGFQRETLATVKSIEGFDQRSVFEKEAVAKAAGIELKELTNILNQDKQISKLTHAQREDYEELLKFNTKQVETTGKELLQQQKMQSVITKIENIWKQIKVTIAEALGPALDDIASIILSIVTSVSKLSGTAEGTTSRMSSWFKLLAIVVLSAVAAIAALALGIGILFFTFSKLGTFLPSLGKGLGELGTGIKSLGQSVGKEIGDFIGSIGRGLIEFGKSMGKAVSNFLSALKDNMQGAAVLVALSLAVIGLAYALKLAAEGIKLFLDAGLGFGEIMGLAAVGVLGLIAVLRTLSITLPLIGPALITLGAESVAAAPGLLIFAGVMAVIAGTALALGWAAKMIGEGFKLAGDGAGLFANSLVKLAEIGFLKLSAGLYGISGAILALSASLITMSASGAPNFLNELASMSTKFLTVASALETIANALERISNIKSFPEIDLNNSIDYNVKSLPTVDDNSLDLEEFFAEYIADYNKLFTSPTQPLPESTDSETMVSKEYPSVENVESNAAEIKSLTTAVNSLVDYMKTGGVIANTYLDARLVSKELGIYNAGRSIA